MPDTKLLDSARRQLGASFAMLEYHVENCPDDLWNTSKAGFLFWQQLLHTIAGIFFWMRDGDLPFNEPFPDRKVYPELEGIPEDLITRQEMKEYCAEAKKQAEAFFAGKDDPWLAQPSAIYGEIINLDAVFMQIRHIQYHVGHCDAILREAGRPVGEWQDYYGPQTDSAG
ncbi:DinB family protein [Brucepastera parasyntrophica]|uniref:DinB family protein n=1 Tax=Brucepastera parasyntrophica TaxID=2880008 RepID=UPI00210D7136|nr:DinB family protein [Brucepastera parasyntrophica]ULQ58830.1 DinB family protein [Brucepastera parasyntrophica]